MNKEDIIKEETNCFALVLLMPERAFYKWWYKVEACDPKNQISAMMKLFGVPEERVVQRAKMLGLV